MTSSRRHHAHPKGGFSLIETCLQMVLLSAVTIPMLMTLTMQKQAIVENQKAMTDEIVLNELFDNVESQHSEPVISYSVPSVPSAPNVSVFCDPATRAKSASDFAATCTGSGKDLHRGPFFKRTVTYLPNYSGVRVTIQLFRTQTPTSPAFYESSREYTLEGYRMATGQRWNGNQPDTGGQVVTGLMTPDAIGNLWYPAETKPAVTPSLSTHDRSQSTYYSVKNLGCETSGTVTTGATEAPFQTAEFLSANTCATGMKHLFKVTPNTAYDVNLYFVVPKKPAFNCVANTKDVSCFLTDVHIDALSVNHGASTRMAAFENFDFSAATNLGELHHGSVLHTRVTTPANAADLQVLVAPGMGNSQVYLSGIEVLRRHNPM